MTEWHFDEEIGGTFALDAPLDERLGALDDLEGTD